MLSQPAFGGVAIFGKMNQFGGAGVVLEDAHGTDGGSFDDQAIGRLIERVDAERGGLLVIICVGSASEFWRA